MMTNRQLAKVSDPRKFPLCRVTWVDSASTRGWNTLEEIRKDHRPVECETVGYLVVRSRRMLSLVQSVSEFGRAAETISIPASCVRKVRKLK